MTISIDADSPKLTQRAQFVAQVTENRPLCREHFLLVLRLPYFPPTLPGQFIQIACRDVMDDSVEVDRSVDWGPGRQVTLHDDDLLSPLAMLRRPFSLAGRRDIHGGVELEIIHRVVGIGTDWLSKLKRGDKVGILGPLGNHFELPSPDQTALLVSGGVGIPPMLYLASALAGRKAVAFCGAMARDLLCLEVISEPDREGTKPTPSLKEFDRHGIPSIVTTDDGSLGLKGFVTQALERYLDRAGQGARGKGQASESSPLAPRPSPLIIYTCGPEPMMKRVAEIAIARNIPCQIAVERAMACGMGTCQSCCIRVKKPDPAAVPLPGKDWCYRLACTDGPVFAAKDLLW